MNCSILSVVPAGEKLAVLVGGEPFGFVRESAVREGVFIAYGVSNVAYVGSSPREAAVKMLVKESWAVIRGPVMEAAAKDAAENHAFISGRSELARKAA